jgi:transcription antitermination factor NusG
MEKGIPFYVPRKEEIRQWHDRKKKLDRVLFPGYVFVQPEPMRIPDLDFVRGSKGLITFNHRPAAVQPREIERIRRVTRCGLDLELHSKLIPGEKVSVTSGPLIGLEGELVRVKSHHRLVINAHILGQSVSLEIGLEEIELTASSVPSRH